MRLVKSRYLASAVAAVVLASCGGSKDSLALTPPHIALTPTSLTFTEIAGAANFSTQAVTVSNAGGGALSLPTVSTSAPWLVASVSGSGADFTVTVGVDVSGLSTSSYTGSVSLASSGADNTPLSVPVTLNLLTPPHIALAPSPLTFSGTAGAANPSTQAVTVSNAGGGSLSFPTVSTSATWLAASVSGSGPAFTVTVGVDVSGLSTGSYSGSVSVASSGADDSPVSVPVTLALLTPPHIALMPAALTFTGIAGAANPSSQAVTVNNVGGCSLSSPTASTSAPWLVASVSGSGPDFTVTVGVNVSGLSTGSYSGSVLIASSGADNTPVSVPVTLNLSTPAHIALTPASLTFTGIAGAANPSSQAVTVSNAGSGSLSFPTVSTSAIWLLASVSGSGPAFTVTVGVDASGLSTGSYTGSVSIASSGADNTPVSVPVRLDLLAPPLPPTPVLVQHVASSTNPTGQAIAGNGFRFTLPNTVKAGNALIVGVTWQYSAGRTISISDNQGNAWPRTPAVTTNDGSLLGSSIYVLPNAAAGATTITVTFDAPVEAFSYRVSEFSNIATVDPVSGTTAVGAANAPGVSCGPFTPGNNDGNGGNLIWSFAAGGYSGGTSNYVTNWSPGDGFALLDADIAWHASGMPAASEYYVQTTSAAITPTFTATMTPSTDSYNCAAVALKVARAGSSPSDDSIRIVRVNHQTNEAPPNSWTHQFPSSGNLLVIATADASFELNAQSISDTNGNTWVKIQPDPAVGQIWYAANATPGNNLQVTITSTGTQVGASLLMYDIINAAASPFDISAYVLPWSDTGGANVTNQPSITPTTSGGLTLAVMALGRGPTPGLDSGSPGGAFFDSVYYTGESDYDTMDNADGYVHLYNSDTSTENWNWMVANGGVTSDVWAVAVHFKGAGG